MISSLHILCLCGLSAGFGLAAACSELGLAANLPTNKTSGKSGLCLTTGTDISKMELTLISSNI